MSEKFVSWGIEFPPEPLTSQAAALTHAFIAADPQRYDDTVESWRCPFLREAMIVGLKWKGTIGGSGGNQLFIVNAQGLHPLFSHIRHIAEEGDAAFQGSADSVMYYAALLPTSISTGSDTPLVQPQSAGKLRQAGIETTELVDVRNDGPSFDITAYVLNIESFVGRLDIRIDGDNGEAISIDLSMTQTESVPVSRRL